MAIEVNRDLKFFGFNYCHFFSYVCYINIELSMEFLSCLKSKYNI